jgi:DNA polymerase sigma
MSGPVVNIKDWEKGCLRPTPWAIDSFMTQSRRCRALRALYLPLQALTPNHGDHAKREEILQSVGGMVEAGLEGYTGLYVEPFGSFVSGLYAPHGDLDISIQGALEK